MQGQSGATAAGGGAPVRGLRLTPDDRGAAMAVLSGVVAAAASAGFALCGNADTEGEPKLFGGHSRYSAARLAGTEWQAWGTEAAALGAAGDRSGSANRTRGTLALTSTSPSTSTRRRRPGNLYHLPLTTPRGVHTCSPEEVAEWENAHSNRVARLQSILKRYEDEAAAKEQTRRKKEGLPESRIKARLDRWEDQEKKREMERERLAEKFTMQVNNTVKIGEAGREELATRLYYPAVQQMLEKEEQILAEVESRISTIRTPAAELDESQIDAAVRRLAIADPQARASRRAGLKGDAESKEKARYLRSLAPRLRDAAAKPRRVSAGALVRLFDRCSEGSAANRAKLQDRYLRPLTAPATMSPEKVSAMVSRLGGRA
eukprot:Hpha_TRINITY_DN36109_c0_g1::TRINITY_DN36109_c0_g1_i1::g.36197::m.36197